MHYSCNATAEHNNAADATGATGEVGSIDSERTAADGANGERANSGAIDARLNTAGKVAGE